MTPAAKLTKRGVMVLVKSFLHTNSTPPDNERKLMKRLETIIDAKTDIQCRLYTRNYRDGICSHGNISRPKNPPTEAVAYTGWNI